MKSKEEFISHQLKESNIENPHLEARWILEKFKDESVIDEVVRQRQSGVPLAYLLREKGFYKHLFYIEEGVLIPRPETELLVELGVCFLKLRSVQDRFIYDFGCGSGCVGLSIVGDIPGSNLISIDSGDAAVRVTKKNTEILGLSSRVKVIHKDLEDFDFRGHPKADLIVMNPPYIANDDPDVADEVHKYEPHPALYSGPSGLESIEGWCSVAKDLLKADGGLAIEFGKGQEKSVREILNGLGFSKVSIYKDLAGIMRSAFAQLS